MTARFDQIIGTGGIGAGVLFETDNNRTLDRNESRMAVLSDARDYCKQHIILHYVATVMADRMAIRAIGLVGDDPAGRRLLEEMEQAGIQTEMVGRLPDDPTMYSVCFLYPDKCVCNITTSNSACEQVTADYIDRSLTARTIPLNARTLILAAPEVPVSARLFLLEAGKRQQAVCVASVLCDEVEAFRAGGGYGLCDVLAVNESEARAIAGIESEDLLAIVKACGRYLRAINTEIRLLVTCGKHGSYSSWRGVIEHIPAGPAIPKSTAGAGDAYLAGIICGLALGLPFQHEPDQPAALRATDLGCFLAEESVKSRHTIAPQISRALVMQYIKQFKEDA